MISQYGKLSGIKGAWNEGWATYFSLAAQLYYDTEEYSILSIVNVADYSYVDLGFNSNNQLDKLHLNIYLLSASCFLLLLVINTFFICVVDFLAFILLKYADVRLIG